jgi:hypothetical protein
VCFVVDRILGRQLPLLRGFWCCLPVRRRNQAETPAFRRWSLQQAEGLLPPILARVSREQCENASGRSAQVTLDERLRLLDTLGLSR